MKLLSIVFSFKNEEKNLQELIERTAKSLSDLTNWKYEMIFVNDYSTDKSEEILLKLQSQYPISIINMSRNFGVGPCVIAGFKHSKGDAIIYIDSDLQDPPEIIKELVKEHEKGSEVVHTVRTKRLGESKIKMFLTLIAYKIINYFSDIPLHVNAGDFKLISRKALDKILELKEFRPYIRGLSVWVGYKQSKIFYVREARSSGKSNFSFFGSGPVNEFLTGITAYSLKPLYVSIILGFLAMFVSLMLILHTIYAKLNNLTALGSAGILISISFFSGIILLSQGITAIYIARIFEQVRGRKRYVIKDIKEHNL
jgi:dolichol-phosphate mannosyltransferase|tara:strand:- start:285 stop:1220 length:936 start_codon:yes stop_codon:yes gene_type:complete